MAVGAPGAGDGGLVFIYMGQSHGLNPQHGQVIKSPFQGFAPAFGFSIRGGTDIDNNGYPGFYSILNFFSTPSKFVYSILGSLN